MNKKIVLAIAALGVGLSMNVSAGRNCQLECQPSIYCYPSTFDLEKCQEADRICDECLTF